jgi:flagellar biosynthesis anti-sigma factor FlgM
MRVDLRIPYDNGALERTQASKPGVAGSTKQPAGADEPSSDLCLSRLEASAASAPEIRQERIQQLRDAITAGTYSVSDEQLAHAMLKDLLKG